MFGLRLDGGYCLGDGGGRLPGSYVFDGRILLFPLAGKDGRYLYRARSGHVRAVWFIFVLRGTCWGCLSRDEEGAGLLDGFVSRWPCGHDTVAHHVLSRRLS